MEATGAREAAQARVKVVKREEAAAVAKADVAAVKDAQTVVEVSKIEC